MPGLHKYRDSQGYYVKAVFRKTIMTLQLTSDGVHHLTRTLGLRDGDRFGSNQLLDLIRRRWAYTNGAGIGDELEILENWEEADVASGFKSSSAVGPNDGGRMKGEVGEQRSAIRIRMEAYDHTILDQSAKDIVENAKQTGAVVYGPIPLPTRIEKYTVIRGHGRHQHEVRTYKRLIDLAMPTSRTIDALNKLSLPAGVDIKIKTS